MILASALEDPADRAVLFFQSETPQVADAFAQPTRTVNRLVTRWRVREWTTVAGDLAIKSSSAKAGMTLRRLLPKIVRF